MDRVRHFCAWSLLIAAAQSLPAMATTSDNLIADPKFETSVSDFEPAGNGATVTRSTAAPLEGSSSLAAHIAGYGDHIWWTEPFENGLASHLQVAAHIRMDAASSSVLQFCAVAYYIDDPNIHENCTTIPGTVGDKGLLTQQIDIDSTKPLNRLAINFEQTGSDPLTFTVDETSAVAEVLKQPDPTGGPGGGGTPVSCTVNPDSVYSPTPYTAPPARPYISVAQYTGVNQGSQAFQRFKNVADAHGSDPYFSTYSIIMYRITGQQSYLTDAIARVDAFVNQFETDAHNGIVPQLGRDHFYFLADYLEPLSLTYDSGFALLTPAQRTKWSQLAEDALENLWNRNPTPQTWFGVTGFDAEIQWAVCDPGNNYYYTFMQGTMLWALASQNPKWMSFLQQSKFPPLLDYFTQFPGGGTREGTGYGTALQNLFKNYLYWKNSTTENLATVTTHPRETIEYWLHATVPTLDRFAPIGDLSRESIPNIYDYQRNLVHQAVVLSPATTEAQHGTWWLQHILRARDEDSFNLWGDLLPLNDGPLAPTALSYHATGAGVLFARSSWATNASWVSFVAGGFDQSHAHQEQGSFTFFKNDWLAVSSNIWSHSGIHQETTMNNQLRFEDADHHVLGQSHGVSTMSVSTSGSSVTATADMSGVYPSGGQVHTWTRSLQFAGNSLRVTDACSVANGVTPIFQLNVPVQPVPQKDGSYVAGNLHIVSLSAVTAPAIVEMDTTEFQPPVDEDGDGKLEPPRPEFSKGYRLEYQSTAGCTFDFQLTAQ